MYYEARQTAFVGEAKSECPVCYALAIENSDHTGVTLVICPRCGKFRYSLDARQFLDGLRAVNNIFRYRISHVVRAAAERATGKRDNSFFPIYSSSDFEKMLDSRDPFVQDKLHSLLQFLAQLTAFPGQDLVFDIDNDFTVTGARNNLEGKFLAQALEEQGFLKLLSTGQSRMDCSVTARGWSELDRIAASSGMDSPNAFVAMWFDCP